MADKVKPLKIEDTTSGSQSDGFPTELNPLQDYVATKGIAFENLDTFRIEKLGRTLAEIFPLLHQEVTYSSGIPQAVSFYNSASFITANRVARYDFTYTGDLLTSEALKIYDTDGTTILRTYTWTHSYTGNDYLSSGLVII